MLRYFFIIVHIKILRGLSEGAARTHHRLRRVTLPVPPVCSGRQGAAGGADRPPAAEWLLQVHGGLNPHPSAAANPS